MCHEAEQASLKLSLGSLYLTSGNIKSLHELIPTGPTSISNLDLFGACLPQLWLCIMFTDPLPRPTFAGQAQSPAVGSEVNCSSMPPFHVLPVLLQVRIPPLPHSSVSKETPIPRGTPPASLHFASHSQVLAASEAPYPNMREAADVRRLCKIISPPSPIVARSTERANFHHS